MALETYKFRFKFQPKTKLRRRGGDQQSINELVNSLLQIHTRATNKNKSIFK